MGYLKPKLRYNLRNSFEINRVVLGMTFGNSCNLGSDENLFTFNSTWINGAQSVVADHAETKQPFLTIAEKVSNEPQFRTKEDLETHFLETSVLWLEYLTALSELEPEAMEEIFRDNRKI